MTRYLLLLAAVSVASVVADRSELAEIEGDVPGWILEELRVNRQRGVLAFARDYEAAARAARRPCNRLELSVVDDRVRDWAVVFERQFSVQMDAAVRSASLLSSLFQTSRLLDAESDLPPAENDPVRLALGCGSLCDDAYYYTVARAFVESDERVLGFGVAFALNQYVREETSGNEPRGRRVREFYPYAYRNTSDRKHILVLDVSRTLRYSDTAGQYRGTEWFNKVAPSRRNYSDLFRRANQSLIYVENVGESMYKVKPDAVVFATRSDARWSVPYFDCKLTSTWKLTFAVPFFGSRENFKGVVTLDIALDNVDIDQCASAAEVPLFGGTHRCKHETTDCVPLRGQGFRLGAYECRCRAGFYYTPAPAHTSQSNATGDTADAASLNSSLPDSETVRSWFASPSDGAGLRRWKRAESSATTQWENANGTGSTAINELILSTPAATNNCFVGWLVESAYRDWQLMHDAREYVVAEYDVAFQCLPCKLGCDTCVDDTPCLAESNMVLRGVPLAFQSFFITICCLVAVLVFRFRKTKSNEFMRDANGQLIDFSLFAYVQLMRASTWLLHELILAGGVLIYFTIVIMYFEASLTTCMTQPWFRQLGFALVYGSIMLRLYRILVEHQSRNARRVHLADRDMLKYVAAIVAITAGYMLIWTSVNVDQFSTAKLLQAGTDGKSKYLVCKAYWWDYLVELGELLFVSACIYLCYCVRSCPTECGEVRLVTIAVCNEALLSGIFHLSRHFFWLTAHPDVLFLAYFVHCHLTVTLTLCLVVGSRVWFAHVQAATCLQRAAIADGARGSAGSAGALLQPPQTNTRTGSATLALASATGTGAATAGSNGELENGDVNLSEMDADEVRAELRRVYAQLQAYKHKAMRNENPHISKRGRTAKSDRRTSAEPSNRRGIARTPEESTISCDRAVAD